MTTTAPKIESRRHMGLELLRSVAMLSIVVQHALMQGGVLYEAAVGDSTLKYLLCYAIQSFTLWGSSVFALITGWLCVNRSPKTRSILSIWLQTAFYTLAITGIFALLAPERLGQDAWENALLPITNRQYWYITCYAVLFLLMPLLNAAVRGVKREWLLGFILIAAVMCGVMAPLFSKIDTYTVNTGYSPWWLAYLYIIGAYIRLYGGEALAKIKTLWLWLAALVCGIVPTLIKAAELYIRMCYGVEPVQDYLGELASRLQTRSTLPLMLLAVCVFLLFLRSRPPKALDGLLNFLSKHSLGVYLIHVQPILFGAAYYIFAPFAHLSVPLMLPALLGAAMAVFAASIAIDFLRGLLFKLLRLDALAVKLGDAVDFLLIKITSK